MREGVHTSTSDTGQQASPQPLPCAPCAHIEQCSRMLHTQGWNQAQFEYGQVPGFQTLNHMTHTYTKGRAHKHIMTHAPAALVQNQCRARAPEDLSVSRLQERSSPTDPCVTTAACVLRQPPPEKGEYCVGSANTPNINWGKEDTQGRGTVLPLHQEKNGKPFRGSGGTHRTNAACGILHKMTSSVPLENLQSVVLILSIA
eukprot:1156843-Pelagomonas_calceolata.AAC.1